jgi:hypothetical protein
VRARTAVTLALFGATACVSELPNFRDPSALKDAVAGDALAEVDDARAPPDVRPADAVTPRADARNDAIFDATPLTDVRAIDDLGVPSDAAPPLDFAVSDAADLDAQPADGALIDAAFVPDGALAVDQDDDRVPDAVDNCIFVWNADQLDTDADGEGDRCDPCPVGGDPTDADGDGVRRCDADCDDTSRTIYPGATEYCDTTDNDCDRRVDEDFRALGAACSSGVGACAQRGSFTCAEDRRGVECDALPGSPAAEMCDQLDNDCDGLIDDGLAGCCVEGETRACGRNTGACVAGQQVCDADRVWGSCVGASVGEPEVCNDADDDCDGLTDEGVLNRCLTCGAEPSERCNGADEDCDGRVDESFPLDEACVSGQGICATPGLYVCDIFGNLACNVVPGASEAEVCNRLDDDCDGRTDEAGLPFGPCNAGLGACAAQGEWRCNEGIVECDAAPAMPTPEQCNAVDDDCDGATDEGFQVGAPCQAEGLGQCATSGTIVCAGPQATACTAPVVLPTAEVCNGLDDDCNGAIDDGPRVCGRYIADHCKVWLGWSDINIGGAGPNGMWAQCPASPRDVVTPNQHCTSAPTAAGGIFSDLSTTGGVNGDDWFSVAFTCADPNNAALATWLQSSCAVYLGYTDIDRIGNGDGLPSWGPCPGASAGEAGGVKCTSSAFDGQFHGLRTDGVVDNNDDFGLAWLCRDAGQPARAASAQRAVRLWFAMDHNGNPVRTSVNTWSNCPGSLTDNGGDERCVGTQGDGLFRRLDMQTVQNNRNFSFGIGLSVIPP